MSPPKLPALRSAIYASCLDASFSRTGACIGVIASGRSEGIDQALHAGDVLESKKSAKARLFSAVLRRPFQSVDRRIRQEILALDGATVLDHNGAIVAVGAIVEVPSGSTGGGRLAAAKRLSTFGLGIKVSADGPIRGYRMRGERFSVC